MLEAIVRTSRPTHDVLSRKLCAICLCVMAASGASTEGTFASRDRSQTAAASVQPPSDAATFHQGLRVYRTGHAEEAVKELAAWEVERLAAAVTALMPALSSSDRMAAADLEAEVANARLVVSWPNVSAPEGAQAGIRQTRDVLTIINNALVLLHYADRAPFGEELGDEPKRWWYYAVTTALLTSYHGREARSVVGIGLDEYPNDPLLLTARGAIATRRPTGYTPIEDYTRAIKLAPNLAIARLRLGQQYFARGFGREARPWLESVIAGEGATTSQLYFAHLLLGRIAASEHNLDRSGAEYQQAYRLGAGYQAACTAVSRNEEALEHQDRAAEVAEDCLRLSGHDDPWPYYRAMDDPDALPHLRAEARGR
jgi:predicted Zn-dependent protease